MALFDSTVQLSGECQRLIEYSRSSSGSNGYLTELERIWEAYRPFASPDFRLQLLTDGSKFYSLTWEMMLAAILLQHGYPLQASVDDSRPDLCVIHKSRKIWIECCLPTVGHPDNPNSVKQNPPDGEFHAIDPDKSVLRCTAALRVKNEQHQRWLEQGICSANEPFIIAINGKDLQLGIHNSSLPDILRALYGTGDMYAVIDPKDPTYRESGYQFKPTILKSGNREIQTTFFSERENANVSGAIYSSYWIGHYSSSPQNCYVENVNAHNRTGPILSEFCQIYEYGPGQIRMQNTNDH